MPLPNAEALVRAAQSGEKLNADHRRHAVGYLVATSPETTNLELAELFDVDEKTIRNDKNWLKQQMAEVVKADDIGLVVADIRIAYERFVNEINKSLKKATLGTATYLNHLKTAMDMQLRVVEALQSLGYYPKNLGVLQNNKFLYEAQVATDGSCTVRSVEHYDHLIDSNVVDAEFIDVPALTEGNKNGEEDNA